MFGGSSHTKPQEWPALDVGGAMDSSSRILDPTCNSRWWLS